MTALCTAIRLTTRDTYGGRNLDLEYAYKEEVAVMPRRFPLSFRAMPQSDAHYAMIGTAFVPQTMPLYYDAVNERGLSMAALNFPVYAQYARPTGEGEIAPFEVIPFVLSTCASVDEATALLQTVTVAAMDYSDTYPSTSLHWFLADKHCAAAVEATADGLTVTADPVDVLTNSPPLACQLAHLALYSSCAPCDPPCACGKTALTPYSRGMGGVGLPGDWSSPSRFVKAAYALAHSECDEDEASSVAQVFRLLQTVAHPRGAVRAADGRCIRTVYSACWNLCTGDYYYETYDGGRHAVSLFREDVDGDALSRFPFAKAPCVTWQN